MNLSNEFQPIRDWAKNKGIIDGGDLKTQTVKLMEEAGELSKAILKKDLPEIIDAIGDCVVVLTNLAALANRDYVENDITDKKPVDIITIESCINSAYQVIANRTGKMVAGSFVKEETRDCEDCCGAGGTDGKTCETCGGIGVINQ
jgi:hypothetical protein